MDQPEFLELWKSVLKSNSGGMTIRILLLCLLEGILYLMSIDIMKQRCIRYIRANVWNWTASEEII